MGAAGVKQGKAGHTVYAAAVRHADTLRELEQALISAGDAVVDLRSDITVNKCLKVRGSKVIDGGGKYRIRRKSAQGNTYKGTLLCMQGRKLILRDVALSGSGRSPSVSGDVNGKLIEVEAGTVVLESGARLVANYNISSFTDGGGGITVHDGGTVVMKAGSSIRDNLTITGGSGIRVEAGGMFVMEGGTIAGNAVLGQREDTGFDGRGGAIHNRGVVLIRDGVIQGNMAAGYERDGMCYGGYGGAIYNQNIVTIAGGTIEDNKGTFAGGAVYTNESGILTVEGGQICGNTSPGQRGGGIYVSAAARVFIKGGRITHNTARDGTQIFVAANSTGRIHIQQGNIEGAGDAVYNNGGQLSVQGGSIRGEECALKTKGNSRIGGGIFEGGQYSVKFEDGSLAVSGDPAVESVYIRRERIIDVDEPVRLDKPCELCPEQYNEGDKLVRVCSHEKPDEVRSSFSLRKKKRFILETGIDGLYVGREKYRIVYEANGGQGSMKEQWIYMDEKALLAACTFQREEYGFAGWSKEPCTVRSPADIPYRDGAAVKNIGVHGATVHLYALWVKRPVVTSAYKEVTFYEGEYADSSVLLHGMRAVDECDGDLTAKIKVARVRLPDGTEFPFPEQLPTQDARVGEGEILYEVSNSFGIRGEYRQKYRLSANEAPHITAGDRYYFAGEYPEVLSEQAKQDIFAHIRMEDDVEDVRRLAQNRIVLWGGLDFQTEGEYEVTIRIKDQYGHRFYMGDGEERQYGTGKTCEETITVFVVKRVNDSAGRFAHGFVRFISEEYRDTLGMDSIWRTEPYAAELDRTWKKRRSSGEVWVISADGRRKIKNFVRERENPFSKETNDLFFQMFSYMRK